MKIYNPDTQSNPEISPTHKSHHNNQLIKLTQLTNFRHPHGGHWIMDWLPTGQAQSSLIKPGKCQKNKIDRMTRAFTLHPGNTRPSTFFGWLLVRRSHCLRDLCVKDACYDGNSA